MDSAKKILSEILFKIKNITPEKLKNFFRNFFAYIFSKRFIYSHNFMMFLIFLLSLTSVYLFFSKFRPVEASDAWFNELWLRRQKIQITYSNSTNLTNFIAETTLPGNSLISSGQLNSDCSDIRIVDQSGNLLNYWVDPESCNTFKTNIYFIIPTLYGTSGVSGGINTYYIYYSNKFASISTVAQTTLFTATIPNLKLNYNFDAISNNELEDRSDLGNNGKLINTVSTSPSGSIIDNKNTFPEGYFKNAFFFNGQNVFVSTPLKMTALTNAYSMISYIKPEGTRANGYTVNGESMGKMFNFENINKTGSTCNAAEYNESDGVASCTTNGVLFTPDAITPKKVGSYSYFYDFYWTKITRPSLAVTFDGTSTDYLYQNNPVNFLPLLSGYPGFGFKYKIKPFGDVGDRRTIHSWGTTSPGNYSYALDYNVCSDGTLRFILDYNNSRTESSTLATPCLNNISPSSRISSSAGKYAIYANSNTWINLLTAQIENKRYISINGVVVASDAASDVTIARENVTLFLGKASNSNKSNFKGEIDEYVSFGQDQSWFRGAYYTGGLFNSTIQQYSTNINKKSYVIFGNNSDNFFQAGFSNHANSRYNTATAISNFNYNFNTNDSNDFYQQYGGNIDNNLNAKAAFISGTHNLFDGSWYLYYTQFDDTRNSIASNYIKGATTYTYNNGYRNTNPNGVLTVGGYINTNEYTATYPSEFFFGGMDEVFVYSQTLSSTQITYHSQPWNGYASHGKTLWQTDITKSVAEKISLNQSFDSEFIALGKKGFWYDRDYSYRLKVNVNSLPNLTVPNFQVSFNVDTSSPVSGKRMNSDCSGIIVTDEFYRVLPFWVENCNSISSKFYVKMNPDLYGNDKYSIKGSSSQSLYIYYGNNNSNAKTYPPSQVFDAAISDLNTAYTFEQTSGNLTYDISGIGTNKNLGKTSSAVFTSSGAYGGGLYLNGLDVTHASFPFDGVTAEAGTGITLLTWTRIDNTNPQIRPIFIDNSGSQYLFHRFSIADSSNIFFKYKGKTLEYASIPTPTPTSRYIFTGISSSFYDQIKIISNNSILSFPDNSPGTDYINYYFNSITKLYLGQESDAYLFSGAFDEVRYFTRALTDTELKAYTNNTTIGSSTFDTSVNTCNLVNSYCSKSFVTPSYPGYDLLGKYNSNVVYTTNPEERFASPQVYFKFNEAAGIYVKDSSGNLDDSYLGRIRSNNLLTGNEPNITLEDNCVEGRCLYFDGLNDYVDISTIPGSHADSYLTFDSDYSYSFWIKPLSNPNSRQTVISFGQTTGGREGYTLYYDQNMRIFTYGSGASTYLNSSAGTMPINKWTHISFVYDKDSKTNTFYINGNIDTTNTNPSACSLNACSGTSMSRINIGGNASGIYNTDYMRGYLDEFKIFKTALTSTDVMDEYKKGSNILKYNIFSYQGNLMNFNLMGYYPFDEIDRNVAFDYSNINAEASYPGSSNLNVAGVFNNAFSSPGIGTDTIRIPNSNFINLNSQVTFSLWTKVLGNTSDDRFLLYKSGTGGFNIKYNAGTQKYSASLCGTSLESSGTFSTGSWDNIVLTSNSKRVKLYINSKLEDEDYCFNNYTSDRSNTNQIRIGGSGTNNETINALIDDFKIYDNYLSDSQVTLLYGYKPTYSAYGNNATAFYKLDASDGTTTAVDGSGNNNTLTMFASATNQNSWNTFGKIGNSYDFTTNASTTKNLFSVTSSTMTTGLTQPISLMGWVAFSEPFYGDYNVSFVPLVMYVGSTGVGNAYQSLSIEPVSSRYLNLSLFSNNADADRIYFSSPYLYLTLGAKNPIWYHVAGTYDGYLRKIYVNGNLVNVDTGTSNIISIGGSSIVLGGGTGNLTNTQLQYNGMLDEAKIYNYARTQEQIKMDMKNAGTSPALNSTVYNSIRSNQRPSSFQTSADDTIYPIAEVNFDSYFKDDSILISNTPVLLEEITFNNVPSNVQNYQVKFSLPISTYNSKYYSEPNCNNLIIKDKNGKRLSYWAEPSSCKNGLGSIIVKFPVTSESETVKVYLDPSSTPSGVFKNYQNKPEDIFDRLIPDLEMAHNFEETSGNISYDSSGFGRNITWVARDNIETGAFGRAPFLDGTNHRGDMPFPTDKARSELWPGFTFLGWIWAQSNKTMSVIDFIRDNNNNYFEYGRFYDGVSTNYQRVSYYTSVNYIANNNNGSEYLFRGFSVRFQGASATDHLKIYDDGGVAASASTGKQNIFPSTSNYACIGHQAVAFECGSNSQSWLGSFDELRIFSRELSLPEYQAYMQNSTNSYIPLGNSGVIGSGVLDSGSPCNLPNNWCTRSFVTPSFPGVDLLGKYNSKVIPSYNTINQPLFSFANNGTSYVRDEGFNGGSAYFFTASGEVNVNLYAPHFNFGQGSDAAISFYIKPTNTSSGSIASADGLKINKLSGNQINFSGANFNLTSNRTLPANNWSHVFFQKNGQTGVFELIIDNELQSASYSASNSLDLSNFKFTLTESTTYFLDEVKIFDTVLIQNQINNLYQGGAGLKFGDVKSEYCVNGSSSFCSSPTKEYLFNEVSGQTAYNNSNSEDPSPLSVGTTTSRITGFTGKGLSFNYLDTDTFATNLINNSGEGSVSFRYKSAFYGGSTGEFIFSGKGISLVSFNDGFEVAPAGSFTTDTELSLYGAKDPWHHININYNTSVTPAQLVLYFDGVKMISGTYTKNSTAEKWMFSKGVLDNLRFYSYQRDAAQVAHEYAGGKPFAHFKFDECSGNKSYNSNSHLYRTLLFRETGSRKDTQAFLNTGLNTTKASGTLNFGNCSNISESTNYSLGIQGKYNTSFYFDGTTYMEGNDYHSRVFNSEGNATITFWINLRNNTSQNVDLIGTSLGTNGHLIKLINKDISIYTNTDSSTTLKLAGNRDLESDGWNHVALVFENGSNYKIYINGNLDNSSTGNFTSILNTCTGNAPVICTNRPFILGKNFTGKIDELKIYNYPLTLEQIKVDMNQDSAVRIQ